MIIIKEIPIIDAAANSDTTYNVLAYVKWGIDSASAQTSGPSNTHMRVPARARGTTPNS